MKIYLEIALLSATLSGCATITRGSNDVFEVNTVPAQAQVTTTNGFACLSPCALKMPRRSEFDVLISKPGYETARAHVTNSVAGQGGMAMAGNVIFGGIIGAGVDAGTGAMLDLTPNPLNLTLAPLPSGANVVAMVASAPALSLPVTPTIPVPAASAPVAPAVPPSAPPVAATGPSLAPLPTQTTKLPGHRVAGYGCAGFAPRIVYAETPDKLPATCERVEPL